MRLAKKVSLVSGASQGLGAAMARRFAEEGASVFVADLKEDPGRAVVAEIGARGGRAWVVSLDVASDASWGAACAAVVGQAGRLDILVNTAGINIRKPIEEISVEELDL